MRYKRRGINASVWVIAHLLLPQRINNPSLSSVACAWVRGEVGAKLLRSKESLKIVNEGNKISQRLREGDE